MPKVGAAISAGNLSPHSIIVWGPLYRILNLVIKAWPATKGVELVVRPIECGVALLAVVYPLPVVAVVLSGEGHLGSLVEDDPLLFWC